MKLLQAECRNETERRSFFSSHLIVSVQTHQILPDEKTPKEFPFPTPTVRVFCFLRPIDMKIAGNC